MLVEQWPPLEMTRVNAGGTVATPGDDKSECWWNSGHPWRVLVEQWPPLEMTSERESASRQPSKADGLSVWPFQTLLSVLVMLCKCCNYIARSLH